MFVQPRGKKMSSGALLVVIVLILLCFSPNEGSPQRPNIVFILADDLGYSDVSWNDRTIKTPNLETLYQQSLKLQNYYVQSVCTPSRAAIMTGYYPFHLGLQHGVIGANEPRYLPLNVITLQESLQKLGYVTRAVGKWHLGFCHRDLTPIRRGFHSFYGHYTGHTDYFKYTHKYKDANGHDFKENGVEIRDQDGRYSTEVQSERAVKVIREHDQSKPLYLYLAYTTPHAPFQVPDRYVKQYGNELSGIRLTKAGMLTAMDEGIGNVTRALRDNGMWNNTILVFTSDNGGPIAHRGFNYPYRGGKGSLFEGGTKSIGLIHASGLGAGNYTGLFHAVDWLPTLLRAATINDQSQTTISQSANSTTNSIVNSGRNTQSPVDEFSQPEKRYHPDLDKLDGISQWDGLSENWNQRIGFVYQIDELIGQAAIRIGRYKLIIGRQNMYDSWYRKESDLNQTYISKLSTAPRSRSFPDPEKHGVMLFDLLRDPYEKEDLSELKPMVVTRLHTRLTRYHSSLVGAKNPKPRTAADPIHFNNTWSPGWCDVRRQRTEARTAGARSDLPISIIVCLMSLFCSVFISCTIAC